MTFFLDENFPKSVSPLLQSMGHTVIDSRTTAQEGCDDSSLFQMSQKERAVFLTTDRDFFHTVPHLYEHHCGAIIITLRQPNRRDITARLLFVLQNLKMESFDNTLILLRDRSYTVRKK